MPKPTKGKNNNTKKYLIIFWSIFTFFIAAIFFVFFLIAKGAIGYLPPIEELQNPKNKNATEVYSSDMVLLGSYFYQKENRVNVTYNELSPNIVNALIATEDARYLDHSGVDGVALMRVLFKTVVLQQDAGGGSTISQQLAKQLYSPASENFISRSVKKVNEWVIAVQLERLYTKEEILTMYLNQFDFLYNAVGIKTASQVYFSTTPDSLKIEEAAMLVGMCKNPSYYNPLRNEKRALQRRNVVLDQMRKVDYITQVQYDSLKVLPIDIKYNKVDHKLGLATYFREYLRKIFMAQKPDRSKYASWQKQLFYEDSLQWANNPLYGWCNKNTKTNGKNYDIYTDGLKIYTTIDSRMQQYAEEAVKEHMGEYLQPLFFKEKKGKSYAPYSKNLSTDKVNDILKNAMRQSDRYKKLKNKGVKDAEINKIFNTKVDMNVFSWNGGSIDTIMTPMDSIRYQKYFLRCGFMSMDPYNGHVKAYVGGPNYSYFQYDMVTTGKRQVGSTIKPFLYTLVMEEGHTPCDEVLNAQPSIRQENGIIWSPRNSSKARIGEKVTLRWGLANSNNWISAYNISQYTTPQAFVNLLYSFGIKSKLEPVFSLSLGVMDISIEEMVSAYTTFPNKGIRNSPVYVTRIEDNNGNVLASFIPQMTEVYSAETSYKMIDMLSAVVNGGTASRLRYRYKFTTPIGAKTGTTQNNSDGWFMGFTPRLVSGCWVGGEERDIHFDSMNEGQGAVMALPIWAIYMQKVFEDKNLGYSESDRFDVPAGYNPCENASKSQAKTEEAWGSF